MKLRGRFTLALALAALAPIAVAAVVTRQVIAASYRSDYQVQRRTAEANVDRAVARFGAQIEKVGKTLASHRHPFVGRLLLDLAKQPGGRLDYAAEQKLRDESGPQMEGQALDVLAITDRTDRILSSPHAPGKIGESNHPEIRERAVKTRGKAYFAREDITKDLSSNKVLVAEASQIARDGVYELAVVVGRRVDGDLLEAVRSPADARIQVDARVVSDTGQVLLPPATRDWAALSQDEPITHRLLGPDGETVAVIQIAVSNGDMERLLRNITLTSAVLAVIALIGVVLIGLLVARRTARDLDQLVAGSLAAARGDLDHRVPVRSEDEVGAVAAAFNFMMEDLRVAKERLVIAERIAAWQEIARRLAHEIKNPLTPIQMAMDTLRKTWKKKHPSFDEILEESTATVMEEADRLKHIVSEFSAFARMPKPEFGRLDLNELVRSALALYQGGAAPIEIRLFEQLPQIDADKNQLNQVVLNLVENARDAIGQRTGGRIIVSTRLGEAGDRAVLIVEDNGPGVPGDLKDKVFAPYFTTKHAKGGTGLGLAIVHRIVSDHGGRIAVADAAGGGARFAIELPLRNGTALLASRI
ncbi:MAG TPA: ATP-binding protein [Kofleriaceae bacterium]|nr:ATP-binding protein [Kofleriaceae bacterium]